MCPKGLTCHRFGIGCDFLKQPVANCFECVANFRREERDLKVCGFESPEAFMSGSARCVCIIIVSVHYVRLALPSCLIELDCDWSVEH